MKSFPHFVFGVLGNITALFLFFSPTITFTRIIRNRSTEQFSGLPYLTMMFSCLMSSWYYLPFVSSHNLLALICNGIGAATESIYVVIFIIFAPKKEKLKILGLLAFLLAMFAAAALFSVLVFHGYPRKLFCGLISTIITIITYGSPLSIMRLVIKTRSVEYMPFFLSLIGFLCATLWFIFGLLGHDPFIAVPTGCGSGLGAMQLILYAIYYKKKPKQHNTGEATLEMGLEKPRPSFKAVEQPQELGPIDVNKN